jgi:fumarate reductase subunit C
MSRYRSQVPTLRRSMRGWWRRDSWFLRYLLREASALFIVAYALVLLAGVASLALGPESFARWRALLLTPGSLAGHIIALLFALVHTWTWFGVMPLTLPRVPLSDGAISALGRCAALLVILGGLAGLAWWKP